MSSPPRLAFSDEALALLSRPLTAVISTISANATPLAVPVWYRFDGARVAIWTGTARRWVRHLAARPACALTVQEHEPPYGAVLIRGPAEVVSGESWIDKETRRIAARYIAAAEIDDYVARFDDLRTIVIVRPHALRTWGQGY